VALRPTTVGDLPALHALFLEAIGGLYRPHGFEPPAPPLEVFANQQRHIIESGGLAVVAFDERGGLDGFASSWTRGDDWFLASLFVAPDAQSRGLGSALLAGVWGESSGRRRTITDAIQPVSNALYARSGLIPSTPVLSFSGVPRAGVVPLAECTAELAPIDAAAYEFDRAVDHAYWGRLARRTVWARAGTAVAYSYAFPGGFLGPVAGVDDEAAAAALECELSRAGGAVVVRIPGSARRLVEVAVRHGLQLSPTPGLLLLSATARPPTALALAGYTLF
jgi:GNAT superfamily N-acetyltransferase